MVFLGGRKAHFVFPASSSERLGFPCRSAIYVYGDCGLKFVKFSTGKGLKVITPQTTQHCLHPYIRDIPDFSARCSPIDASGIVEATRLPQRMESALPKLFRIPEVELLFDMLAV